MACFYSFKSRSTNLSAFIHHVWYHVCKWYCVCCLAISPNDFDLVMWQTQLFAAYLLSFSPIEELPLLRPMSRLAVADPLFEKRFTLETAFPLPSPSTYSSFSYNLLKEHNAESAEALKFVLTKARELMVNCLTQTLQVILILHNNIVLFFPNFKPVVIIFIIVVVVVYCHYFSESDQSLFGRRWMLPSCTNFGRLICMSAACNRPPAILRHLNCCRDTWPFC